MIVVDGKYIVEVRRGRSYQEMLNIVDYIVKLQNPTLKTVMKNKEFLIILPLCFLLLFNGKKYDQAVKERL